ncbi:carbohydrate ABC transporter permease [Candidatus Hydrogenedentota bacterium]
MKRLLKHRTSYFFLLPTFALLVTFNYVPAFSGLFHAFTEWSIPAAAKFIGFDNFVKMWNDIFLRRSIINQIILLTCNIIKTITVPLLIAELLINLKSTRLQYWLRTLFIIPMVVPAMVGVLLWKLIYDPNIGLVNNVLVTFGMKDLTRSWLGDPDTAIWSIVGMGFPWIHGFALLIYLAGLMAIPKEVHDAAAVDGAGSIRRFFHIDLPMVVGQIKLLIILTTIGSLQDFQAILVMTQGGPGMATLVPPLHMYNNAFAFKHHGYAAAIGFTLFVLILLVTIANMKLLKSSFER